MSIAIIDTRKTAPRPAASVGAGPTAARLPPVDVMVVDDDRDATDSLCALLWWRPGIHVATATSADVPDVVLLQRPAVCLVSAELGPCFMYRLHELPHGPRVLAYTDYQGSELDGEAVLAGAAGSVWRYGDPDELAETIRLVAAGGKAFPALIPETIDGLIDQVEDRTDPSPRCCSSTHHSTRSPGFSGSARAPRCRGASGSSSDSTPQPPTTG